MRIISEERESVTREIVHAGPFRGHRPLSRPTDLGTEPIRQTANPRLAIRRITKNDCGPQPPGSPERAGFARYGVEAPPAALDNSRGKKLRIHPKS